jgi:hypothetical protein
MRKLILSTIAASSLLSLISCGPSARSSNVDAGPNEIDAPQGPVGAARGRIWAPGLGPATVGADQAIPVAGATIYVTNTRPEQIPNGVYCQPCQEQPIGAVRSDHLGNFVLPNAAEGTHWLIIEKAQFRLEIQVTIREGETLVLTEAQTTLPSKRDYAAGTTVPHIAIATGGFDHLENILGHIGMGSMNANGGFVSPFADIDIYSNSGSDYGASKGTLEELVRNPAKMRQYHIIFVPCSGATYAAALKDQTVLRNIRDFVKAGGKLYVTDWSGEWMDNVFPAQIELGTGSGGIGIGSGTDTPASAYNAASDTWNTSSFGDADGDSYDSNDATVLDSQMAAWLGAQRSPTPENPLVAPINASKFDAVDNWNWIRSLNAVRVGSDAQGAPVIDTPKAWVSGSNIGLLGSGGKHPLTVTFEPAGCGRVLYSTYHTTPSQHTGLFPQERILLYLMMEIGVCIDNPIVQ